jgi:hypothetical protein
MSFLDTAENVVRAIEFGGPEYVPVEYLTYHLKNLFELSDIVDLSCGPPKDWRPSKPGETVWGFVFDTADGRAWGMGRPKNPPLTSWDKLESYRFPDPHDKSRFERPIYSTANRSAVPSVKSLIESWGKTRYLLGSLDLTMFSLMQCLRGDAEIMIDMYRNRDMVEELADKLLENHLGLIETWSSYGVNGVICYDDWGTQRGLFFHPKLLREIFLPRYRKMIQVAHKHGMQFIHHCCGNIHEILGSLIEIELDAIQLDQPELAGGGGSSGVDRLGKSFGGKICFMAGVDIQGTLVKGTLADIEGESRHLIETFGSYDGGFVARLYTGPESIGLTSNSPQYETMYRTFREYGKYPRK